MRTTPCNGKVRLFESTTTAAHHRARVICADCPLLLACHQRVRDLVATCHGVYGPTGTWAGELFTEDRIERMKSGLREVAA